MMTEPALLELLKTIQIPDFNYTQFFKVKKKSTTISLALSGGGYRSMLTGSGIMAAYDKRTPGEKGILSGLFQATTYFAGISGGSWLVMSNFVNDNRPSHEVWNDEKTWDLQDQLLEGVPNFDPDSVKKELISEPILNNGTEQGTNWGIMDYVLSIFGFGKNNDVNKDKFLVEKIFLPMFLPKSSSVTLSARDTIAFFKSLQIEARQKKEFGYPISFTDYWGRAISRKIFGHSARGLGVTMTMSTELASFRNFSQPFPIVCSVERTEETPRIFESTPYEFGTWDGPLRAFAAMKYMGSALYGGFPVHKEGNSSFCTMGLDNVGFITASSSSLFNKMMFYAYQEISRLSLETSKGISSILELFGVRTSSQAVYAVFSPNPFLGFGNSSASRHKQLYVADGGDSGENIPFRPFLVPFRNTSIVFAFDMTSDSHNFPNGTSLQETFDLCNSSRTIMFPNVPTSSEIVEKNMNKQPFFLGCHLQKYPWKTDGAIPPLIVYTANYNHSFESNRSTFQMSYSKPEVLGMVQNGYNMATLNNSTDFAKCIGCAILKRDLDREEYPIPPVCHECYSTYCYS